VRNGRDWVLRARAIASPPPSGEASHHSRRELTDRIKEDHIESLGCREMGVECPFRAEGETGEEVKAKMLQHAAAAHVGRLLGMSGKERAALMKTLDEKIAAL
jgi:predicted small metal-binding protein